MVNQTCQQHLIACGYNLHLFVTSNTSYQICLDSKGMDFILPGGDNSFVVIIHTLDPFIVIGMNKGMRGMSNNHQF